MKRLLYPLNPYSVAQLAKKSDALFQRDKAYVIHRQPPPPASTIQATATQERGLYVLHVAEQHAQAATTEASAYEWHLRLGHPAPALVSKLAAQGSVHGLPDKISALPFTCSSCAIGKKAAAPFSRQTSTSTTTCLGRVTGDLCGPFPVTGAGSRYFNRAIDETSRYAHVCFLKAKAEVATDVPRVLNALATTIGLPVKCFHTDGASEYASQTLQRN
jgi:transposase InsO family protein